MTDTSELTSDEADSIMEVLRTGIPPVGHLRQFTVGRQAEIQRLQATLQRPEEHRGAALLVEANYGAGKTHLLRLLRELALHEGYAVALVTVDSQSAVRFNRMDQVTAAVMRAVELDESSGKGVWNIFEAIRRCQIAELSAELRQLYLRISASERWDYSDELKSAAMFVALRAWVKARSDATRNTVRDWLSRPWEYKSSRRMLYDELVWKLHSDFRDPRPDSTFYADGVFVLDAGGHQQAWSVLADIDKLVRVCGRRGLVLLFDEFEDVIQNLNNIRLEQDAFVNLFRLFSGEQFPGMSYFAVTPEFSHKCRDRLYERYVYTFPVERFDEFERFQMTPIGAADFTILARRIRAVHGLAYDWEAETAFSDADLDATVAALLSRPSTDQIRQAVEGVVAALDDRLDV